MSDYDAIVVGAGHNGLTAAAVLQQAGLRTVCLEANTYTGGMAATVELIDGFRYEIAGSVQFPMPSQIAKELGLDTLPTVDAEVMSVNLGDEGEEPMIFYRDPMQFMTHLADKHGTDAVTGMAELIGWSQGPAKALGRFDVRTPPKTLDAMYACAANEAERTAIHDVLFGTAMDAIDRYLPDKHKHAVLRSMLAFLAINSTYRGPYTPGSATCLAFALAVPDDTTAMMTKLEGGIGALCEHLHQLFVENGGEVRYRAKVEKILVKDDRVTGVRLRDGSEISAPVVVSNLSPDHTLIDLVGAEHLPPGTLQRLRALRPTFPCWLTHIGLAGVPAEVLEQAQGYYWDSWDMDRVGRDALRFKLFVPTLYEPAMAPPRGQVLIVQKVQEMDYAAVTDWPLHKEQVERFVLGHLSRLIPGIEDKIVVRTSASAQTSWRFTLNHQGAMLGWEMAPDQLGERRPAIQSPFKNLYFVGHWAQPGGGITPVMISAMQTVKLITRSAESDSRPVPGFIDVAAAVPA